MPEQTKPRRLGRPRLGHMPVAQSGWETADRNRIRPGTLGSHLMPDPARAASIADKLGYRTVGQLRVRCAYLHCGEVFSTNLENARYCSSECKALEAARRQAERKRAEQAGDPCDRAS